MPVGFTTASGKLSSITSKQLQHAQLLLESSDPTSEGNLESGNTGSGKKIQEIRRIETALERQRHVQSSRVRTGKPEVILVGSEPASRETLYWAIPDLLGWRSVRENFATVQDYVYLRALCFAALADNFSSIHVPRKLAVPNDKLVLHAEEIDGGVRFAAIKETMRRAVISDQQAIKQAGTCAQDAAPEVVESGCQLVLICEPETEDAGFCGSCASVTDSCDLDDHQCYWNVHCDQANMQDYEFASLLYLSTNVEPDIYVEPESNELTGASAAGPTKSPIQLDPTIVPSFVGGHFAFVDEDADRLVAPAEGRLLVFSSGFENIHQVRQVKAGCRIAFSVWFRGVHGRCR
jgi:hypothetical protein